ncbi:MAG: phosphate ABC transporter substrate-binding/OmpA family protein [Rhodobacteraceae bacterium]|nr:phosphate ABC transporter substrate-binding/OmpA family protein [Paracoccaceae bacterium]
MKQFLKVCLVVLAASGFMAVPAAMAQENIVILRSIDQNFEASGELVSADSDFYVLRTIIGEMNVPRADVECIGDACPSDSNEVTLSSADGSSFSGELLGFDGTNYILKTTIGELTIRSEFVQCEGDACPIETQEAEKSLEVVLRSADGTFFSGTLQDYDGTNYVLETSLGVLTIRGEFVQCEGDACPETGPVVAKFTIVSPPDGGIDFIAEALARFVDDKSLSLTRSLGNDGNIQYLIGGNDGALVADITVAPSTDTAALEALFSETAAFALTRETPSPESVSQVTGIAISTVSELLNSRPIALDALVAVINPDNPVTSISINQIGDILSGRITNWAEIGGEDLDIVVHAIAMESTLAQIVRREILAPRGLQMNTAAMMHAKEDTIHGVSMMIEEDRAGFAVSFRSAARDTQVPSTRNTCNMFSSANAFSLQTGEYPLTMTWSLHTLKNQDISDFAVSLADYLVSDQGQAAAKSVGLVGLEINRQPMSAQGERLLSAMLAESMNTQTIRSYRDYLAEVSTASRLSTTLRFITGSANLDARGIADVQRISNLIRSGALNGDNLMLVGFSDSVGGFTANVTLSRNRATAVKNLLLQENIGRLGADDILTFGFGPVAPVGCNSTTAGKDLNRRVEVWVRGANQSGLN